ncbi:MAG: YqiJ family protein [Thalassovita sp.]
MIDLFLAPQMAPFSVALAVVTGLFVIEICSLFLGSSVLGIGSDGPDIEVDADFDLTGGADPVIDLDVDAAGPPLHTPSSLGDLLTWTRINQVPFLIWLVSFLTSFGLVGIVLQSSAEALLTRPLPASIAVALAFMPALAITRVIANWVSLLMPQTETSALRVRSLGGHRGVITQGTAARGTPAEAKIKDRHGNTHYLRVEPLEDGAKFAPGSDVTLIRKRNNKFYVI